MSYSLETVPNDPALFAATPPMYAVWVETTKWFWDQPTRTHKYLRSTPTLGQVRHFNDIGKVKKRITSYASLYNDREKFTADWAIYKWNGLEYELVFDGHAGEVRADNEFYKRRFRADPKISKKKSIDYEVEAAVASILGKAS